jgi:hypothetical protein
MSTRKENMTTTKYCPRCKTDKPLDSFGYEKSKKDKKQGYCKSCVSNYFSIAMMDPKKKKRKYDRHVIYMREEWLQKPENRAASNLRTRNTNTLRHLMKNFDSVKESRVKKLFYIDKQGFMDHLESLFEPGMSWDNYGAWHLDHIKDLGNFNLLNDAELRRANHYKNIRPMWATGPKGNLTRKKSSGIIV